MKLFMSVVITLSMFASVAFAETRYATITRVEPMYHNVGRDVTERQCYEVEVPVYGNVQRQGNAAGGALGGMIIGGILGKGITGNSDGAAAGAVLGGIIGADQAQRGRNERVITGYQTEHRCDDVVVQRQTREIKNYRITYQWSNIFATSYTYNQYRVGDRISVTVSINAN